MAIESSEGSSPIRNIMMDLLADKPPYVSVQIELKSRQRGDLEYPPSLSIFCQDCKMQRTWQLESESKLWPGSLTIYICCFCNKEKQVFLIAEDWTQQPNRPKLPEGLGGPVRKAVTSLGGPPGPPVSNWEVRLRKVGQWPSWNIDPPKGLIGAIGKENGSLYRKALVSISHNHGIAAVAYFRRIIEETTSQLLDIIESAIKEQGGSEQTAKLDELEKARAQQHASDRLKLAVSLIPSTLRPGGINPLERLYATYSQGLHSESDDNCIGIAMEYKTTFDFFFITFHDFLKGQRDFATQITQIQKPSRKPDRTKR